MGKKIKAHDINQEIQQGTALLVDVRDDEEWDAGHAVGAMHLSVDRILSGELPTQDTKEKIYLYCAAGGRAFRAASYLESKGYQAECIGGLGDWKRSGGAVE